MLRAERGYASTMEARCRDTGETWDPAVVICGPGVASEDAQALLAVGGDGAGGICVLVVADGAADYRSDHQVVATSGSAPDSLELFGQLLEPQRISVREVDQVARLLDVASDLSADGTFPVADLGDLGASSDVGGLHDGQIDVKSDEALVSRGTPAPASGSPGTGNPAVAGAVPAFVDRYPGASVRVGHPSGPGPSHIDGDVGIDDTGPRTAEPSSSRAGRHAPVPFRRVPSGPEVEVAVLGPVEIRGAARHFTRAWARELVVYLSMHAGGSSNDVWATALWPERVMAPSSLHSTASVARRSLGKASDGRDHLPRSHGRLALASSVGTDWDRFLALSETDDPVQWRQALELVRGRPFEGLRSTDWAILDGTAPAIESAIVDLSGRFAGACLRSGDPRRAEWSARRGLLVSPYDERLYRMLLRAADAAGNPSGVEAVMAELVRVVADEIEPVESVHPSTLALYRSLSRRRAQVT
jgi:DNA-binding SARP family transcriptional activator